MTKATQWIKAHRAAVTAVLAVGLYVVLAYTLHIPCPIRFVTGLSCPGCGMTRALSSLVTLDFAAAWYYHPMVYYFLVAAPVWVVAKVRKWTICCKVLTVVTVTLMLAVYVGRLVWFPSPVLVMEPQSGIFARLIKHVTAS